MLERFKLTVAQGISTWRHLAPSQRLRYLLDEDLDEEVDQESDTDFMGPMGPLLPPLLVKTTLVVHLVRSLNVVLRTH